MKNNYNGSIASEYTTIFEHETFDMIFLVFYILAIFVSSFFLLYCTYRKCKRRFERTDINDKQIIIKSTTFPDAVGKNNLDAPIPDRPVAHVPSMGFTTVLKIEDERIGNKQVVHKIDSELVSQDIMTNPQEYQKALL